MWDVGGLDWGCFVADVNLNADMEKLLVGLGAVKHGDSRLSSRPQDAEEPRQTGLRSANKPTVEDDDSDWD